MIKIEHPDLHKIANDYYEAIVGKIQKKCIFLGEVFNVLYNSQPIKRIEASKLHGSQKKSLVNQLVKNKIDDQKSYSQVSISNLKDWVVNCRDHLQNIASLLQEKGILSDLILCSPHDAIATELEIFRKVCYNFQGDEEKKYIASIIDYSLFDDFAYPIAQKLGINTCPYCNRTFINTVISKANKGIIRPTFDHFYSQKDHPLLGLSFFNLIPSCYYCNSSLKGQDEMSIDTHIHPYVEGFENDAIFDFSFKGLSGDHSNPENFLLFFRDNTPSSSISRFRKIFGGVRGVPNAKEGSVNMFKLNEIYQSHLDIVGELYVKCNKLNSQYANSLSSLFQSLGTGKESFYQFYFGNYFSEKDFNRRPFAKLTKDIVSQRLPYFKTS